MPGENDVADDLRTHLHQLADSQVADVADRNGLQGVVARARQIRRRRRALVAGPAGLLLVLMTGAVVFALGFVTPETASGPETGGDETTETLAPDAETSTPPEVSGDTGDIAAGTDQEPPTETDEPQQGTTGSTASTLTCPPQASAPCLFGNGFVAWAEGTVWTDTSGKPYYSATVHITNAGEALASIRIVNVTGRTQTVSTEAQTLVPQTPMPTTASTGASVTLVVTGKAKASTLPAGSTPILDIELDTARGGGIVSTAPITPATGMSQPPPPVQAPAG